MDLQAKQVISSFKKAFDKFASAIKAQHEDDTGEFNDLLYSWEKTEASCRVILNLPNEIDLDDDHLSDLMELTQSFEEACASLGNRNWMRIKSELCFIKFLASKIKASVQVDFKIFDPMSEQERAYLKHYVETGKNIRASDEFPTSASKKLESFLLEPAALFSPDEASSLASSYFVLSAPSMVGKTQFAFTCSDVKPLYFPMLKSPEQKIYKNFGGHVYTLMNCAERDLENFNFLQIDTNARLFTLGFLKKLAEIDDFDASRETWLEFFARRKSFAVFPISMSELGDCFKGFALFLDEFSVNPVNTFIRDLGSAVGIPTIIVSSNATIAKGQDNNSVRSFVVTKLDPAARKSLNARAVPVRPGQVTFPVSLDGAIDRIIALQPDSTGKVAEFLRHFRDVQLAHLRPGIAAFVSELLKRFATQLPLGNAFNLGLMLDWICTELKGKLCTRKSQLFSTCLSASIGHVAILLLETTEEKKAKNKSWRHPIFMENHLFYLENPVDSSAMFLTSPHEHNNLMVTFREEEFFAIAGCLFIPYPWSVTGIFDRSDRKKQKNYGSKNFDLRLNRSALEAQAAVCIMRASHYKMNGPAPKFSSQGVEFVSFLANVINELRPDPERIPLAGIDSDLLAFLSSIKVPFLRGVNRDVDDAFVHFSSFEDGVFVSEYTRISEKKQIDGKFTALNVASNDSLNVACDCRNRNDKIGAGILLETLKRFKKLKAQLGLIVCSECVNPKSQSKFADMCMKGYRFYRVQLRRTAERSYTVKKLFTDSFYPKPAKMNVIVLETEEIKGKKSKRSKKRRRN